MHLPFIFKDDDLQKFPFYSKSKMEVAKLIYEVLLKKYDFMEDKSKLFIYSNDAIRIANKLYENRNIINYAMPGFNNLKLVDNQNKATRVLSSFSKKNWS